MNKKVIEILLGVALIAFVSFSLVNKQGSEEEVRNDGVSPTKTVTKYEPLTINSSDSYLINNRGEVKLEDIAWYERKYESYPYGIEYAEIDFQERSTDISMRIYEECMQLKGYRKPTEENAKERFEEVFGMDLTSESNEVLYPLRLGRYVSPDEEERERKRQQDAMIYTEEMEADFGLFWKSVIYDKEGGFFVICPDAIWLVDVEGLERDEMGGIIIKSEDAVTYILSHDKLNEIIHQNNYIFHNSEASFIWLQENDAVFLRNLCCIYGYDTVPEINEMVIKYMSEYYHDESMADIKMAYKDVFFYRDLAGKLHVREGLLDYISYFYTQCSESEYIDVHDVFNSYKNDLVVSLHGEVPEVFKDFSKEDRMKMTAYIGYYYNKAEKIETYDPFREELANNEEFVEYIKKNDYFGLKNYAEIIEKLIQDSRSWRTLEQMRQDANED